MRVKKVIDITRKISIDMPIWPGDSGIDIKRDLDIKKGDDCNLSSISMGLHTGTHIDSPYHFIDSGNDVVSLDLMRFVGKAKLFDIRCEKAITADDISDLPINEGDIIIFKTPNSALDENSKFKTDFIYLEESAAALLVSKKVKTVGVDYLSVDGYASIDYPAHHILLSANLGIIEGLYLKDVSEGEYFLSCLPLKIEGVEGSPVRAVLLEIEEGPED